MTTPEDRCDDAQKAPRYFARGEQFDRVATAPPAGRDWRCPSAEQPSNCERSDWNEVRIRAELEWSWLTRNSSDA